MPKEKKGPTVIVACRVMEPELECVGAQNRNVDIPYLDRGLHRTPDKMAARVQEQIDEVAPDTDQDFFSLSPYQTVTQKMFLEND